MRLKKARRCRLDAREGLKATREEKLAHADWIDASERELEAIRQTVQSKIDEIRAVRREFETRWR